MRLKVAQGLGAAAGGWRPGGWRRTLGGARSKRVQRALAGRLRSPDGLRRRPLCRRARLPRHHSASPLACPSFRQRLYPASTGRGPQIRKALAASSSSNGRPDAAAGEERSGVLWLRWRCLAAPGRPAPGRSSSKITPALASLAPQVAKTLLAPAACSGARQALASLSRGFASGGESSGGCAGLRRGRAPSQAPRPAP